MNLKSYGISLVYALLLIACAYYAGYDTFAFAFGIGDGGGQASLATNAFLFGTLAGGIGLVIAALGSCTQWRVICIMALVSLMIVMPAAVLFGWQGVRAYSHNSQYGIHTDFLAWASAILPPFLYLLAGGLSWSRLRRFSSHSLSSAAAH